MAGQGQQSGRPQFVGDLVALQASRFPDSTAVSDENDSISYADLHQQSSRIASLLRSKGVRRGDRIPILTTRCSLMVVCILAISKAGACYIPIDLESWGSSRIEAVLATVESRLSIVIGSYASNTEQVVWTDELIEAISGNPTSGSDDSLEEVTSEDLAYIIFTSGTTGQPKGVVVAHRNLVHYVQQGQDSKPFNLGVTPSDRVLSLYSISFDACTGVIFSTVCNGGHLVLSSPARMLQDLERCTILPITPSLLGSLTSPERYESLHSIFVGGESPSQELIKRWWSPNRRMFNAYGPTETTVASTMARLIPDHPITLGEPINDSRVLLLDSSMQESHQGEICISGIVVAEGYFRNPDLTQQKFFIWNGERTYRTGDFGRRTEHGIEYLGREDSLVKNRGFLINLDKEIVPMLTQFPGIRAAAAFMWQNRLVAFVSPKATTSREMRHQLTQTHDQFHIPDVIHVWDELPLTPNSKLDIRALRKWVQDDDPSTDALPQEESAKEALRNAIARTLHLPVSQVSEEDSFWDLGGNSMAAIKVLSELRDRGWTISIRDLLASVTLASVSRTLEPLELATDGPEEIQSPAASHNQPVPLTSAQMAMIRECLSCSTAYYMVLSMFFTDLEMASSTWIKDAWFQVLRRHQVFGTQFDLVRGTQVGESQLDVEWLEIDMSVDNTNLPIQGHIQDMLKSARSPSENEIFRPSIAFRLIKFPEGKYALLWLVHHTQMDGWSTSVLLRDFESIVNGQTLPPPVPFASFAAKRSSTQHQDDWSFWRQMMDGFQTSKTLARRYTDESFLDADEPSPESKVGIGLSRASLESTCRDMKVLSATVFHAAWALLLGYYLDEDRVTFGSVLSGRNFPMTRVEEVVGPLLNTCPFALDIANSSDKTTMLERVQTTLLKIFDNQWSADEFVWNHASKDHPQLLETILALEYDLPDASCPLDSWSKSWTVEQHSVVGSGLHILVEQAEGEVITRFRYACSQYDSRTIGRMQRHFHRLCTGLLDPQVNTISDLYEEMVKGSELQELVRIPPPAHHLRQPSLTLKDAFENAADQWPRMIAVESPRESITYAELDAKANAAAHILKQHVKPTEVVAVLSDGSLAWIIAVLSVVKCGAVYMPVDDCLPDHRKEFMIETSKAAACVIPHNGCRTVALPDMCRAVCFEDQLSMLSADGKRLDSSACSEDPAYLIFTSGSTGTPKAVVASHGPILSYLISPESRLHAEPGRKHAQLFSVGFDVSVAEMFGTLCYGATLLLKDPTDPFIHLSRANATMGTPSLLSSLKPEDFPNLDTIFLAGEPVPQALVDRWASGRRLYNGYGPCECTIVVLVSRLESQKEVTVGCPVPRTAVYLLDSQRRPVPIGYPGEICISGYSVSAGYIGNPMETKKRFVPDPFDPTRTMYCTGDLGMWTETHEVKFLGRYDNQVKVRGFRVELEEIERAILREHPAASNTAAIELDGNIYAFVAGSQVEVEPLKRQLRKCLPHYACPTTIFPIDAIPTTSNIKVDRQALRQLVSQRLPSGRGRQPSSPMEKMVEDAWKETLGLDPADEFSVEDDFIDLGGNSLRQLKAAQKLSDLLGRRVPLATIMRHTTIAELSTALQEAPTDHPHHQPPKKNATSSKSHTSLSYLETEVYRLHAASHARSGFNVVCAIELRGEVDEPLLRQAIMMVIAENDILRARYIQKDGELQRQVYQGVDQSVCISRGDSSIDDLDTWINQPFDLSFDQPIRVLIGKGNDTARLTIVVHHIVIDKASLNTILRDVSRIYGSLASAGAPSIEPLPTSTSSDYSEWAQRHRSSDISTLQESEACFWRNYLIGKRYIAPHRNPLSGASPGSYRQFTLDSASTRMISHNYLAASAIALRSIFGSDDITMSIPYMDRTDPGTADMMGTFLDRLPVFVDCREFQGSASVDHFPRYVREQTLAALSHVAPFQTIAACVDRDDLLDVVVTYNRQEDSFENNLTLPNVECRSVPLRADGAKFPLMIEFSESGDGLTLGFDWDSTLYDELQIDRLHAALLKSLEQFSSSKASAQQTSH